MKKRLYLTSILLFVVTLSLSAQQLKIDRLEPMNWWVGFESPELQILVYGPEVSTSRVAIEYPGVTLKSVQIPENPNYLFLNLTLDPKTPAGIMPITFKRGRQVLTVDYPLLERSGSTTRAQGFDASDVIYLIMPDRFANGNPENDSIHGMLEKADRNEPFGRHGGDLAGVRKNLDYISDLGMTALWLTPIFENDMPGNYAIGAGFYHGYAATDMYKVDRRFGTNDEFKSLVEESQRRGMKVIMDMIHNHVGTEHWFIKDKPSSDWVHDQLVHGNTNYRTSTIMDPYASDFDKHATVKGWFVDEMPDLDQRNEFLATYLIQNTLWWIEYSGIDGIRMDTHPYPYKEYMARWTHRVLQEFPDFNIVGEAWMPNVATTAFWQYDFPDRNGYNSFLPSVTDFPLYYAVTQAFTEENGWDTGISKLYYTLSQDFLYTDPLLNVIFVDNHDLNRYFSSVGENPNTFKMGLAFILTTRGIPQLFYGTEIMMAGAGRDPEKRRDFPGGWIGDTHNAFTSDGRVGLGIERGLPVQETYDYLRRIVTWRKSATAIHNGNLTHFVPDGDVYVYFRYNEEQRVLVAINSGSQTATLNYNRYKELMDGFSEGIDITTDTVISDLKAIQIPGRTTLILDLKK